MTDNELSTANSPWLHQDAPALVAHRGFAQLFPENTLTSIAAAIDAGARFIEFDLQLSQDHVPFLMHDDNFERTASLNLNVFDTPMKKIETISVGEPARLGGRFHDVNPITLNKLVGHLNEWPGVHSFVEVKRQSIERFGLALTMDKILKDLQSLTSPFTIISFLQEVVEYTQEHSEFGSGWVLRHWNDETLKILDELNPDYVYCNYEKITPGTKLPEGKWKWVLYEVIDKEVAQHWREQGAHMIETMAVTSMLNTGVFGDSKKMTKAL